MKKRSFSIFIICYISYVFIYVSRLNLSMAAPSLKELAVLDTAQIGLLGSVFSVVYAFGRLFSGLIGDRQAPWKMISLGLILCGITNLFVGIFPPFGAILLLWSINAFSQSMLWGAILRILSAIYPENIAKKYASYMSTAVASGNLLGILLNTALINRFGPQWAFLIPGGSTLLISYLVILFTHRVIPAVQACSENGYSKLLQKKSIQQMLLPAVIHGVMKDNISLWMTVYIMDRFGIDLEQSSYFILLIPTLGFIGRLVAPTLYRITKGHEKPLLLSAFFACLVFSLLLIFLPISAGVSVIYLSLIYMAVSIINVCFLAFFPIQFAAEDLVSSVSGIMDFATYLGTGLSAIVFGLIIDVWGYESMFFSWSLISLLAVFLLIRKRKNSHTPINQH